MTTIAPQPATATFETRSSKRCKTSNLAILSLAFGVLQYFFLFIPCWLVTIPFGVNALYETDVSDRTGRRFAIAGITLSAAQFAVYAFVFVWLLLT